MFPTRLCLSVADDTSGRVTLDDHRWGRQAMKFKNPGRAVLRAGTYQTMQLYRITAEQETEWLTGVIGEPLSPLPEEEMKVVQRALTESDGKMTIQLLKGWGMQEWAARSMLERYELRGWVEKDPAKGNMRCVTPKLAGLLSNHQTAQTASNPQQWSQTTLKPSQTLNLAGV